MQLSVLLINKMATAAGPAGTVLAPKAWQPKLDLWNSLGRHELRSLGTFGKVLRKRNAVWL